MKTDHHCKIFYTFSMLNKVYAMEYNKQFLSTSGALKFEIYKLHFVIFHSVKNQGNMLKLCNFILFHWTDGITIVILQPPIFLFSGIIPNFFFLVDAYAI